MKNFVLCFIACVFLSSAIAQDTIPLRKQSHKEHELMAGIGILTLPEVLVLVQSGIGTVFSGGNYNTKNLKMSGAYNFSYQYFLTALWALNATYSHEYITNDLVDDNDNYAGREENKFNAYMLGANIYFARLNNLQLYSGLNAGLLTYKTVSIYDNIEHNYNETTLAFQITGLGFRIGHRLAVYGEVIAFGNKGALNGGLSYRF